MIQFEIEITSYEFDSEKFNKQLAINIGSEIKTAASKFLTAALRAIPTFNAPAGGIESARSTGFVAGAFINLKLAIGKIRVGGPTGLLPSGEKAPTGLIPIIRDRSGKNLPFHEAQVLGAGTFAQHLENRARDHPKERGVESVERTLTRTIRRNGKNVTVRIRNDFYTGGGGRILKTPRSGAQFATPIEQVFKGSGRTATFNYSINIDYFSIQDVSTGRSSWAPWKAFDAGNAAFSQYIGSDTARKNIFPDLDRFFVKKTYKVNTNGGINITRTEALTVTETESIPGLKFF